ncbi:ester cyclase [Natronolimnobius baerhuensis]|uniref:Ester cyclase n=1 Tax=Natronolimnobius baerhuensis TaxID=253108 RepID=A0A202EAG4_9EURY|nr:ester cyclase [Natronolimnobius baerhuensis]OVE85221.1 ester cyclase [Natronolimnobius baerhuensis]
MLQVDPRDIVQHEIEAVWNDEDLEEIDELVAEEFVYHNPMVAEEVRGPEEYRQLVENFRGAVSEFRMEIDAQIADDDSELVATRFRTTGIHDRELMGVDPTGNEIDVTGMLFDRIEDGMLVERYVNDDAYGFMRQLGLIDQHPF